MPRSPQRSKLPRHRLQNRLVQPGVQSLQVRRARVETRVSSTGHRPRNDPVRNDHTSQMHWSKHFHPGKPAGYMIPDVNRQPRQPQLSGASEPLRKVSYSMEIR